MDFRVFVADEFFDKNIWLIIIQLSLFVALYLVLFHKQIWSVFDPLFFMCVPMGGASFCVWLLAKGNYIDSYFVNNFFFSELALVLGLLSSYYFSSNHNTLNCSSAKSPTLHINFRFLNLFVFISGFFAAMLQLISFYKIGFVIFQSGVNHVSVYDDFGIMRAFLTGFRTVFVFAFFFKYFQFKLSFSDRIFFIIYISGIVLSGSKSAIFTVVTSYMIVNFYLYKKGVIEKVKIRFKWILVLACFPIVIIMITTNANYNLAFLMFGARVIGSGDIFVMGYDHDVINSLSEKSFFKYVFYPGFGSILKNIGFSITPPEVIGVDIYDYYYGVRNGGPNARHNYFGLVFLGPYLNILYSFICGSIIGFVRAIYTKKSESFLGFLFLSILYFNILSLITDINIFTNSCFWSLIVLLMVYSLTSTLFNFFYKNQKS